MNGLFVFLMLAEGLPGVREDCFLFPATLSDASSSQQKQKDLGEMKRFAAGPGYYVLKPESTDPSHKAILVDRGFRFAGTVSRVFKKGSELLSLVED